MTILIENTAGAGSHLGSRFEELHNLLDLAQGTTDIRSFLLIPATCWPRATISPRPPAYATLSAAPKSSWGSTHVHLIHANDSRAPLGSRVDRHASIGEGHIGLEGFRRILHSRLRSKPFIWIPQQSGDDRRNLDSSTTGRAGHTTAPHL